MANKSFVVQYLIKAREQYVQVAGRVELASKKMRASILQAKKAFVEASAAMRRAGTIMTAAVTVPLAFMARSLKNAARDAEETRSKFRTVFKSIGPQAEAAADQLAKGFGLAGTKARELIGDTGDILTGFGFTQKAAFKLSTQVTSLAVDLASFTNFSGGAKGASAALTKALLGERESLKTLGIAILEEDVKKQVAIERAQGMRFATLRQAKANATFTLALLQSKNAVGDFARTQHELANQERITASRIVELKEAFGRILAPMALKMTKLIRRLVDGLNDLSPTTKKAIVIIAALAAVIGPILLALGSIVVILPMLKAGFLALGVTAMPALLPILGIAALIAAGAFLIIKNWDKLKAFFSSFSAAIQRTLGPTLGKLVEDFKKAAGVVVQLFGGDSDAAKSLMTFSNLGELIGQVIGTTLDLLIRGLSGVGALLGQLVASVVSLDFTQFDFEAIKAEFTGANAEPILAQSRIDVGVNVGLDSGLKQTAGPNVSSTGVRRTDVGVVAP